LRDAIAMPVTSALLTDVLAGVPANERVDLEMQAQETWTWAYELAVALWSARRDLTLRLHPE
jgi:hypothetical protein